MRIIKINRCGKECPYNHKTYCFNVIEKATHERGMNHPKRFTRIERSGKYPFPEWCPLEELEK